MNSIKTVAVIPIKLNNERTPGKNTKPFSDGTPLMHFIQRACLSAGEVDEVYVYCSQESVKEYIIPGVKYLKRDVKFDSQSVNMNDIFMAFATEIPSDIYVIANATSPFIESRTIDKGVRILKNGMQSGEYDSAVAVRKMQEFIWKDGRNGEGFRPSNYDPLNIPRTQDLDLLYVETTGIYIYTKDVILEKKTRIGDRPYMLEVTPIEAVDINYPIDFEIASAIYDGIVKPK